MKKAIYPVLCAVVLATAACGGGRNATTQPASTDEEASLVLNGAGAGAELDSSTSDTASDAGSSASHSLNEPDTSRIESDLAEIDGDLAQLDAELNEGSSELGRTEANPGE